MPRNPAGNCHRNVPAWKDALPQKWVVYGACASGSPDAEARPPSALRSGAEVECAACGVSARKETLLEDFSAGGAKVRSRLDVPVGQTLEIVESEGVFRARAEVRGSYVGPDGVRRLHLRFLPPSA